MKIISLVLYSLMIFSSSFQCLADDKGKQIESSNQSYFKLLSFIETAKNKNLSVFSRQEGVANIISQMTSSGSAANWMPLKNGFFDIMTDDPAFFFSEMLAYPDQLDELMTNFSLNWFSSGESNYPEKKQLALKNLKVYIENEEKKLELSRKFKKIIEKTEPSVID